MSFIGMQIDAACPSEMQTKKHALFVGTKHGVGVLVSALPRKSFAPQLH